MVFDIYEVGGIGDFDVKNEEKRDIFTVNERVFLVVNKNTIEVRCDRNLSKLLQEKYESVMESRYFGKGGIEVVMSGQMEDEEVKDLVRLSYNLTKNGRTIF